MLVEKPTSEVCNRLEERKITHVGSDLAGQTSWAMILERIDLSSRHEGGMVDVVVLYLERNWCFSGPYTSGGLKNKVSARTLILSGVMVVLHGRLRLCRHPFSGVFSDIPRSQAGRRDSLRVQCQPHSMHRLTHPKLDTTLAFHHRPIHARKLGYNLADDS